MYELALKEPVDFPDQANCLLQIAHSYVYFHDYKSAIPILLKTTQYENTFFSNNDIVSAMNSLGICYRELGKRDSSNYYFRKVLDSKDALRYFEWEGISQANLGYNLILEGKPEQAIPLLEFGIERAKQCNDYGTIISASLRLANLYLSLRKPKQAKPYIDGVENVFRLQPDQRSHPVDGRACL